MGQLKSTSTTKTATINLKPSYRQQLLLYALLSTLTALSLNIILPAYSLISASFGALNSSQLQQMVLMFVVGMFGGELVLGILSDHFGRRPVFIASLCIYLCGSIVCLTAANFFILLMGRLIQGIGAAGQKVSLRAIIRDQYAGSAMARFISLITLTSVATPLVAPLLGQGLATHLGWRSIFVFLFIFGGFCLLWFLIQQGETLTNENKNTQGWQAILTTAWTFVLNPHALGYTLVAGLLFGIQLTYVSLIPVFFSEIFHSASLFAYYFGFMSSAYGCALIVNSLWVVRWGMHRLVFWALTCCCLLGGLLIWLALQATSLSLGQFVLLMCLLLFSIGLVFGNIIALVMEPLGQIAGLGGALSASISSMVALLVSATIGWFYHQTLMPFGIGICLCSLAALLIVRAVKALPLRSLSYHAVDTQSHSRRSTM